MFPNPMQSPAEQKLFSMWNGYRAQLSPPSAPPKDRREELASLIASCEGEQLSRLDALTIAAAREELAQLDAQPVRRAQPPGVAARRQSPSNSFEDDNDFFLAVARAGIQNHVDPRLLENASGDLVREGAGADGGYALPVDKRQLQTLLVPAESICGLTDILYTPSNAVTLPVDEDPVWSATMEAADVDEGAALTETKPVLKTLTLTLVKRGVLVRVTGEMLEDGTGIGAYVLNKTGQKLSWKLDKICVAAFLASGAKITVAKTATAAAGSAPDLANIQKMWTSMPTQFRRNAIWLANPQLETTLQGLKVEGSNSGVFPIYLPSGGLSEGPYAKIYGRPVIYSELAPAVGTAGDLTLVAPDQFFCAMKTGGPRTDVSIHAEFAKDVVGYRSYVRAVCASKFSTPITRPDGTTVGNVVTVATRA